jgi:nitrite reductase/ring-hydroxylating ferredoxin subunit/uncharacterized membrane protein
MTRGLDERIVQVLNDMPAVARASKTTRKLATRAFLESPFRAVKNFLNGTWLEHPLHPVLTDVPIGAWTAAMVLDLLALATGNRKLGEAAGLTIGVGALGATGAAVTGIMDYTDTDKPEDRVAFTHGLLNLAATALFAASFAGRRRANWETQTSHLVLSGAGYALVTVGAFLGGSLVFRHGVMVNRNAYRQGPRKFTAVAAMGELEDDKPKRVLAGGEPVMLIRRGERVHALGAVCSHYGAPMNQGKIEGDLIVCPWHYSAYRLEDGGYERGPTTAPLPCYDVRIKAGQVEIRKRS